MKKKGYLVIAGSINFFFAALHLFAIFIGAPAYYFLGSPQLAVYTELGFHFPAWITFLITCCFILFGLYAFCSAGTKIKLPFQSVMIRLIGAIFLVRGLFVFWFAFQLFENPTDTYFKEIVFSLLSIIMGLLYWLGFRGVTGNEKQLD